MTFDGVVGGREELWCICMCVRTACVCFLFVTIGGILSPNPPTL